MVVPGWPHTAYDGRVGIRPLRMRDAGAWSDLRLRNEAWLAPWDGRVPGAAPSTWHERNSPTAYGIALRTYRREARLGRSLPFAVVLDGDLVGQITVASVIRGAAQWASVGYWVSEHVAGQGVMASALSLVVDHCLGPVGLHRVEAQVRPENRPSCRLVEKLGFREEGLHQRLLFIDGEWRDHLCFAVTAEDVPHGMLARWHTLRGW
jgi:ribosomal-protein-alanine N-acetyltransferase